MKTKIFVSALWRLHILLSGCLSIHLSCLWPPLFFTEQKWCTAVVHVRGICSDQVFSPSCVLSVVQCLGLRGCSHRDFYIQTQDLKRDSNRFLEDFWDTWKKGHIRLETLEQLAISTLSKWDTLMQEYNRNNPWIFLYISFLDECFSMINSFYRFFLPAVIEYWPG